MSVLKINLLINGFTNNDEKTILSVSKNNSFFQGFKAKVGSESMNNSLSIEYKKITTLQGC